MKSLKEQLESNGYVVIPSVLTSEEVARARKQCVEHLRNNGFYFMRGKTEVHAAAKMPDLSWLFCHPAIVESVKAGLGDSTIAFTGHCDAFINSDVAGWHKDDGRGKYLYGNYFREESCRVYKVGVYLQDHSKEGGLSVRHGSHVIPSLTEGDVRYCSTKPGDIVVFDIRITHRGRFSRGLEGLIYDGVEMVLPKTKAHKLIHHSKLVAHRIAHKDDRVSLFFTFGAKNEFTRYFAQKNMERQLSELNGKVADFPIRLCANFEKQKVAVYSHDF